MHDINYKKCNDLNAFFKEKQNKTTINIERRIRYNVTVFYQNAHS